MTVDEDTVLTCRTQVARSVIFPSESRGEDTVHEQVLNSVGLSRSAVAETVVDGPHLQSAVYFFVLALYAVAASLVDRGDGAVLINLIVLLRFHAKATHHGQENANDCSHGVNG